MPFIIVFAIAAWAMLKLVPVRANFREQLDIFHFSNLHGFWTTSLYMMTFGLFSGFAATFPLMIKQIHTPLPGGPDSVTYAFLGPLVGCGCAGVSRADFRQVGRRHCHARVNRHRPAGLRHRRDLLHPSRSYDG